MNWETYKGLSNKQKEEYNFKFANKNVIPNISKLAAPTITIMLLGILLLMQTYLIQTDDRFVEFKPQAETILQSTIALLNVALTIILIIVVIEIIISFSHYYKRRRWFKNNNIKVIKKRFLFPNIKF